MERNVQRGSAADRGGQVKGFGSSTTRRRLAEVGTLMLGEVYYAKVRGVSLWRPTSYSMISTMTTWLVTGTKEDE